MEDSVSELYNALSNNDTSRVLDLIGAGISPNVILNQDCVADDQNIDCVDFAIKNGQVDMLQVLLENGFNLELKRSVRPSALHKACILGNVECVKLLIKHGDRVNRADEDSGDSPLMKVVACYQGDLPFCTPSSSQINYLKIAGILLQNRSDVNAMDCQGNIPLNYSVRKCDSKMTTLLLQNGSAVNGIDKPPIFDAVSGQCFENLKLLIEWGASVNVVTSGQSTPLHMLLRHMSEDSREQMDVVQLLISSGASVNVKNSEGWSPLYQSVVSTMYNTMNMLLQCGGDVNDRNLTDGATILLTLTRKGHYPGVVRLLHLGAHPNLENKFGSTPLWASVFTLRGDMTFVKLFLSYNCSLDVTSMEHNLFMPKTPCQLAIEWNLLEVGKILAYAGCKVKNHWLSSVDRSGNHNELQTWLLGWRSQPRNLQDICRIHLRSQLGLSLQEALKTLNLPQKLKKYIELRDLLE